MNLRTTTSRVMRSAHVRFVMLLVLIELLLGGAILAVTARQLHRDLDARDVARVTQLRDDLVALWEEGGPTTLIGAVDGRETEFDLRGEAVLLADRQGHAIAGNMPGWPDALPTSPTARVAMLRLAGHEQPRAYLVLGQRLAPDRFLLVGGATEGSDALRESIGSAVVAAIAFALPLALIGAWGAMLVFDSRIDRINRTAARVAGGQIGARVPLDGSGDRFDRLAANVNAMLERIAGLVGELRALSDALAHDLRSPIMRLRARIERAQADPANEAGAADTLVAIGREADQLLAMLEAVLAISRAEAGLGQEHMDPLDLAALVEDMAELYAPLAEDQDRAITAQIVSPGLVVGHRSLLGQALTNLIDNALKHGAGDIALRLTRAGDQLRLAVVDEGKGIAEEDEIHALSRFGRLDAARTTPGAGLGLSLVAALARLHGGTLGFERGEGSFGVVLTLPAPPTD